MNKKSRGFILYTLLAAMIMAGFSVGSDDLPYVGADIPFFYSVYVYLAVTINSLAFWFILSMVPGLIHAANLKESILFGGIFAVAAITFYFMFGGFPNNAIIWYGISSLGGTIGGATGYLAKRNKYILLLLIPGFFLQLLRNGTNSWNHAIGIAHNLTICVAILFISIYIILVREK
ncbi:hypothetical protein [Halobacillus salinus]|uniref:Uncharacterized protein n=1 Tax=Halobacillus salinus TaxID=192814 RepID=A0A4Z0H1C7_9BACI|nr:hypothetical protein [Halobacillus salinus]TGB03684.1 hypothetical protein E4663_01380 [Halobacillus salinus]